MIAIPAVSALVLSLLSLVCAPGFAAVALAAFFPLTVFDIDLSDKRSVALLAASYLPALLAAVLFASPLAAVLGTVGFSALHALFAIAAGVALKYLSALAGKLK